MIEDKILPPDFEAMIKARLGDKTADILLPALNGEPDTSVRENRRKKTAEPLYEGMTPVSWCASGHYIDRRPQFTFNPLLHAGTFYVQDASSMVYESIVASLAGETPVKAADLCAAPGGKTTAILNALPDGSVMLANEFVASRAKILKENLCKYGYPETVITNTDVARLNTLRGYFDIVAVDAPCSGEGMMRKEEAARSQWSEGLVRQCSTLQREILESAADLVAPGGYLIYSTCTFNTTEDEENAAWIADSLGLEPVDTGLAGKYGIQKEVEWTVPCLRFMPGFIKGEGLFVAVFRKNADESGATRRRHCKNARKNDRKGPKTDLHIIETANSWIDGQFEIRPHEGRLLALTPGTAELLDSIPSGVRIVSAGIEIGEIKGKDLIPSHQLAMSTALAHPFPEIELNEQEAIRYLSRDAINLPESTPKGYVTVTYKGHPLGFLKNHGNRSNSLYPQDYRIKSKQRTDN